MAFVAAFEGFGPVFYIAWGSRKGLNLDHRPLQARSLGASRVTKMMVPYVVI